MKLLHALLIILLAYLYNADPCTDKEDPTKAGDCTGLEVDKEKGYIKCCYYNKRYFVSGKLAENTTKCVHKKQVAYDDLYKEEKSLKGAIKASGGVIDSLIVDCSSNYLYISLLSLIIFLI